MEAGALLMKIKPIWGPVFEGTQQEFYEVARTADPNATKRSFSQFRYKDVIGGEPWSLEITQHLKDTYFNKIKKKNKTDQEYQQAKELKRGWVTPGILHKYENLPDSTLIMRGLGVWVIDMKSICIFQDAPGGIRADGSYVDGMYPGDVPPVVLGQILEVADDETVYLSGQSIITGESGMGNPISGVQYNAVMKWLKKNPGKFYYHVPAEIKDL